MCECARGGLFLSRRARARSHAPSPLPPSPPSTHQARKGQLADEQLRRPLVLADLAQGDRAGAVAALEGAGGQGGAACGDGKRGEGGG